MSLDAISIGMIEPLLRDSTILCLGVPDMPKGFPYAFFGDYAREHGALDISYVDAIRHRGIETLADLNEPLLYSRLYDLVINPGTLEHCFNIGQAWMNAWNGVAVHGHLMSVVPVTMLNHGYWNVSPIAFADWCGENGGSVVRQVYARNGDADKLLLPQEIPNSKSGRGCFPPETVAYVLTHKNKSVPTKWPTQGAYR